MGTLAYAFCQYYPDMKITVCDLEPVVSAAHHFRPSVEACPNQANVSFVVGDIFKPETIPKAELYVLSHVLHDWSEEKVDLILSNVYKSLTSGNFSGYTTLLNIIDYLTIIPWARMGSESIAHEAEGRIVFTNCF